MKSVSNSLFTTTKLYRLRFGARVRVGLGSEPGLGCGRTYMYMYMSMDRMPF